MEMFDFFCAPDGQNPIGVADSGPGKVPVLVDEKPQPFVFSAEAFDFGD